MCETLSLSWQYFIHLQIDVMVLYTAEARENTGQAQVTAAIAAGFASSNQATANSGIDLDFNLVHVGEVSSELGLTVAIT